MARAAGETGNHGPERKTMGQAETEDRGTFQGSTTDGEPTKGQRHPTRGRWSLLPQRTP